MLDAEALHRICQVEGVLRFFPNPNPPPLERVQKFIAGQRQHWKEYGYDNWGIVPSGETEIIGWAVPQFLPETGENEVGYLHIPCSRTQIRLEAMNAQSNEHRISSSAFFAPSAE